MSTCASMGGDGGMYVDEGSAAIPVCATTDSPLRGENTDGATEILLRSAGTFDSEIIGVMVVKFLE